MNHNASGDAMIKNLFSIITLCIVLSFISRNAHAVFFTIQLKNGNKIKTEKYWKEGQNIRFFIQGGYVRLPEKLVEHIARSDSALSSKVLYYQPESSTDLSEEERLERTASLPGKEQKADIIKDIEDRISIYKTNIVNTTRNKSTYSSRKEKSIIDKAGIENRIAKIMKDSYITSKDRKERLELEESKLADIGQKINEFDDDIKRTEDMLVKQTRMKERLEKELARLSE